MVVVTLFTAKTSSFPPPLSQLAYVSHGGPPSLSTLQETDEEEVYYVLEQALNGQKMRAMEFFDG